MALLFWILTPDGNETSNKRIGTALTDNTHQMSFFENMSPQEVVLHLNRVANPSRASVEHVDSLRILVAISENKNKILYVSSIQSWGNSELTTLNVCREAARIINCDLQVINNVVVISDFVDGKFIGNFTQSSDKLQNLSQISFKSGIQIEGDTNIDEVKKMLNDRPEFKAINFRYSNIHSGESIFFDTHHVRVSDLINFLFAVKIIKSVSVL
jgi:hypothetical protein